MDVKVYSNIQQEGRIFKIRLGSLLKVLFLLIFLFFFFVISKFLFSISMWFVLFVIIPVFSLLIYFRFFDKSIDPFNMEKKLSRKMGKKRIKADCIELL